MTEGCCTPSEHDPSPEEERTAGVVLDVIVAAGLLALGGVVYLVL